MKTGAEHNLNPIRIGDITLSDNVILAPMTGVSDLPFRMLVKSFGAGLVVSEMIASKAVVLETRNAERMTRSVPTERPFSVQLAGCDPEIMAEAAKLNEDRGADIIDINFGCPVKKVVNGMAGSALMREEGLAERILEATAKAVKIPVTLKMRMGWDHNSLNAARLAKTAENVGIKMITIHGRTRNQMYKGSADWHFIRTVKDALIAFASTPWTMRYSCNSVTAGAAGDGVDRITTNANLVWASAGSAHSWIVLRQTGIATNFELLLSCENAHASGTTLMIVVSPAAGFTGGTTTARPTATDEVVLNAAAVAWAASAVTALRWHLQQSTDGQCTRIITCAAGSIQSAQIGRAHV